MPVKFLYGVEGLDTIHSRHLKVKEYTMWHLPGNDGDTFSPACCLQGIESVLLEERGQDKTDRPVIVDNEYLLRIWRIGKHSGSHGCTTKSWL